MNSGKSRISLMAALSRVAVTTAAVTTVCAPARALAYASPFESYFTHATDGGSPSVFLANPAAFLPSGYALGVGESIRSFEAKSKRTASARETNVSSKRRDFVHGVGFLFAPTGGFGLGITAKQHVEEQRSTNDNSQYRNNPAEERWLRREAQARFALEFTKNFRMGAQFRYQTIHADVLGSFNLDSDEKSSYKGTLYGAGVGAQLTFDTGGFGLVYNTPLRGKVTIQSESKVTTDPGALQVNGYWWASPTLGLGAGYTRAFHEKDELAEPTTGPNPDNQTQISLLGLSPEARFLALQTVSVGLEVRFAQKIGLRLTPMYEQGEYVRSTAADPEVGEKDNAKNVAKGYHGRAAILLYDKAFELQVGVDYVPRKHSISNTEQTDTTAFKTEELHSLAAVTVVF